MNYPKRLIEVDLPIKRISEYARREKSIRHGHISTLHIWWARRPMVACRAVLCAALWPDPVDEQCPQTFRDEAARILCNFAEKVRTDPEVLRLSHSHWTRWHRTTSASLNAKLPQCWPDMRYALLDFIADFANWDASTVPVFLEAARALTQAAHESLGGSPGTRPLVVDPFAGGGSIPLEALRVGADAFASDLNPVAVLLNKVVLEYIPKYGHKLVGEVRKWGLWIKEQAKQELAEFYPKDPDRAIPIAYLWARTIICEGPGCGTRIPILRSLWLSKRQRIALKIMADKENRKIHFIISSVKDGDPQEGTVRRGSVTCPCCSYTNSRQRVEAQMVDSPSQPTLLAVVVSPPDGRKSYRLPSEKDLRVLNLVDKRLKEEALEAFIPDEELPYLRSIFNVYVYGIRKWANLFDNRQRLAMATLVRLVSRLPELMTDVEPGLVEATCTCLGLAVDRLADFNTNIARWANNRETSAATFGRQALGMVWDYCETVPISESTGSFSGSVEWIIRICEAITLATLGVGQVWQASAANLPLLDDLASVIFTDPPYYDAVPYANLSDFFYVWLKRSIKKLHPDLFVYSEAPKEGEAVQLAERNPKYAYKTRKYFEDLMAASFLNGRRFTQSTGIGVIVFAHKTTDAWEALLSAVIEAGWTITASWPIDTEWGTRLRAHNSAALASSIHLVCRPRKNADGSLRTDDIGDWRDVLHELPIRIHEWMPRLAQDGVVGADAIFACLGPALEIFSRFSSVERADGQRVSLKEYLEYVWAAISKEAINMIFLGAETSGFEADARLTAMWLWTLSTSEIDKADGNGQSNIKTGPLEADIVEDEEEEISPKQVIAGYMLEFDAARKIAQGLGANLDKLSSLVEIKGSTARLRSVTERGRFLFDKDGGELQVTKPNKKDKLQQLAMFSVQELETEFENGSDMPSFSVGGTMLERLHQTMLLFAAGRSSALKRFLTEEGVGQDQRFWRLAQALSSLYPQNSEERRWVEGVQGYKKGLGL